MSTNKIKKIRTAIDKIDDQIHQLIIERGTIVQQIGKEKNKETNNIHQNSPSDRVQNRAQKPLSIRPAREAMILRRLKNNHTGRFPITSLARIWHEMMSAYTQTLQSSYKVAVHSSCANDLNIYNNIQNELGTTTPITLIEDEQAICSALEEQLYDFAIFSASHTDNQWWCNQALGNNHLYICLSIPMLRNKNEQNDLAYACATITLESSGQDRIFMRFDNLNPDLIDKIIQCVSKHWKPVKFQSVQTNQVSWLLNRNHTSMLLSFDHIINIGTDPHEAVKQLFDHQLKELKDSKINAKLIGIVPQAILV